MRTVFAFLACVTLLLSLGMASAAHAMEPVGVYDVACAASDTAGKEKSDTGWTDDKGVPHAHACHGHHIAAEPVAVAAFAPAKLATVLRPTAFLNLPDFPGDPSLDPPRA